MRIFLNYKYFSRTNAEKLIRNESNNEHWPTANDYLDQLKEWLVGFDEQQAVIKDYLKYLNTTKVNSESFVIKIVNDINTKLRALNAKDKLGNYLIERTENIKQEIQNLRAGLDFPEWPLLKTQLQEWSRDPQASLQRVKNIFASYSVEQWETIYEYFKNWNDERTYPIQEVSDLLDDWQANKLKVDQEFDRIEDIKSLQIQLKERTDNYLRFIWRIPLQELEDNPQLKNRTFPNIKNYLFYLNGEYYEVSESNQTNWETVEIIAEKSMFYNGYWWLIKAGANGWIHHHPINAHNEVCNCQPYDYFDSRNDFICDYELNFALWKIGKSESKKKEKDSDGAIEIDGGSNAKVKDGGLEMIMSGLPRRVLNIDEEKSKVDGDDLELKVELLEQKEYYIFF